MSFKLVFVHGWGFNSHFWQPLISELAEHDCKTIDLGFIKGGETSWSNTNHPAIYVGHSLGVLWLLEQWKNSQETPAPHALISIAGFTNFSKFTNNKTLKLMHQGLAKNPAIQLNHFWRTAGEKTKCTPRAINQQQLDKGLSWLQNWNGTAKAAELTCPKLILATKADKIVPAPATQQQWPGQEIIWHQTASHIMPATDPTWTAKQIIQFLSRLEAAK